MKKYDDLELSPLQISGVTLATSYGEIPLSISNTRRGKNGIYEIFDLETHERYIGQSRDLAKRKVSHFYHLRWGTHPNFLLQNAYFQHGMIDGKERFVFRVILYCNPSELTFYESLLIKALNPSLNRRV